MTLINNANTTTNWSGWGNNTGKWGASADIKKQGAASNAMQPNATGDSGWGYTAVGGIDLTANIVTIWVFVISPSFVDTMDNKGLYIRICTGASWTTEYSDYYMGGRDSKWCGRGWHLLVLDANRTADATNGTTNKASIARIGVGFNVTATASKSDVIAIDAMYYGTGVEVVGPSFTDAVNGIDLNDNGGSADTIVRQDGGSWVTAGFEIGDFVKLANCTTAANDGVYGPISNVTASTLTIPTGSLASTENNDATVLVMASVLPKDIYNKDGPVDDVWWGVIDQGPQGLWVINYKLIIGDVSGAGNIFFYLPTKQLIAADQALDATVQYYLQSAEDTGETHILFGGSTGTGDTRVGFGGAVIIGEGTDFDFGGGTSRSVKSPRGIDFDAEITSCEVYGSAFISMDGGLKFAVTGTDHYLTNVSFQACGQVDIGGVESRNLTFTGYSGADGALLWRSGVTDLKNSFFLANSNDSGDAAAIEHDTAGSETYNNLKFNGNDYDINNSVNATTCDSYSETNRDGDTNLDNATKGCGQSFVGNGGVLSSATWYLKKTGSPTGNAVAKVYNAVGGLPSGAALDTSEPFDVSALDGTSTLIKFDFEGGITLTNLANYVITIEYANGDASNYVMVGHDASSPTHGGDLCTYNGSTWTQDTGKDACFYVRTGGIVTVGCVNGANASTHKETGTPPGTTIINNNILLSIHVKNVAGQNVQDARAYIARSDNGYEYMNELTLATGKAEETISDPGTTDIIWRVRKSSASPKYIPREGTGQINGGFTLVVTVVPDDIA